MSLHECPRCGNEVATNAEVGGAFALPPTLYCPHGEVAVEMDVVTEAKVNEEAIADE